MKPKKTKPNQTEATKPVTLEEMGDVIGRLARAAPIRRKKTSSNKKPNKGRT